MGMAALRHTGLVAVCWKEDGSVHASRSGVLVWGSLAQQLGSLPSHMAHLAGAGLTITAGREGVGVCVAALGHRVGAWRLLSAGS